MSKAPNLNSSKYLQGWGTEVSLEPSGSQLPLAQNNPHSTQAYLGVTPKRTPIPFSGTNVKLSPGGSRMF